MTDPYMEFFANNPNAQLVEAWSHAMITSLGKFGCQYKDLPELEELGKLNYIDTSKVETFDKLPGGEDMFLSFLNDAGEFAFLPPFEECLMKVHEEKRGNTLIQDYFHIKVRDVDTETGRALLDVQVYWRASLPPYPPAWMPVQHYVFTFRDTGEGTEYGRYADSEMWLFDYLEKSENFRNGIAINVRRTGRELDFPEDIHERLLSLARRCNIRNDVFPNYLGWVYDIITADISKRFRDDATNITTAIAVFNYYLSKHHCVQTTDYDSEKAANPFNLRIDKHEERVVRRLGSSVIVRSVKAPRLSSKERGVVYKLSSWSRRGHLRHYQSGKVVWIREQQVHRKAFGDNESGSVTKRDYYVEPELSKTAGRNEAS